MEHRNSKNATNQTTNKANNKASNKATNCSNSASNSTAGKHPNQYTKGADDKSAKNSSSKNCK